MRLVNYEVKTPTGNIFCTTSYRIATEKGNHINKTFLTDVDERTEEQKEKMRMRAQKTREFYKSKRA